MRATIEVLRYIQAALWVILALVAVLQWRHRRRPPEAWIAATFGLLGAIAALALFIPDDTTNGAWKTVMKLLVATLVLFPYFLFQFAGTFRRPSRPWRIVASGLTAGLVVWSLIVTLPGRTQPRTPSANAFIAGLVAVWFILSIYAAATLWRGGRGQPAVPRRRMRTMAAAVVGLSLLLIVSGSSDPQSAGAIQLSMSIVTLLLAPMFLLGFAPPRVVTWVWRMGEESHLREIEQSLLRSADPEEVARTMLPHAVRTVGGSAGMLKDHAGNVIGTYGDGEPLERLMRASGPSDDVILIPMEAGSLLVHSSPFAPYFGVEEMSILTTLASMTDLVLARAEVLAVQQKATEELRIINDTTREFVAIASHDLRTPIAVVLGLAASLDEGWDRFDDDMRRQQIAAIRRQGTHLTRLVEDLLAISRIEAQAIEHQPVVVNVKEATERTLQDLIPAVEGVTVDIPDDLQVLVDSEHFTRMLNNYLLNARTYGQPPIEITGSRRNGRVEVRVRDHGLGVSEGNRGRLFEKFWRADKSKSRAAHGTGLGLAIVRGLARTAGGDAWYEQTEQGPCFAIGLPSAGSSGSSD